MAVELCAFEVPPEADAAFMAAWRGPAALHRALRADVALRYVAIGPAEGTPPFPAHAGVYEPAHEDGEPSGAGGALLIEFFAPPAAADERYLASWERARAAFAPLQGRLGARLLRACGPARFRFVSITRWSSPLMYARALKRSEVQATAPDFPAQRALYLAL
jgi:hypothetical protein